MKTTSNTVYAKDDSAVTIFGDHPEHGDCIVWLWDNGSDGSGEEVFPLNQGADELEAFGREDLADLVREALEG